MDPIPPIRRASSYPAAVERVRRITRTGEDRPADERRRPRREAAAEAIGMADPAAPAVDGDGHVDARA